MVEKFQAHDCVSANAKFLNLDADLANFVGLTDLIVCKIVWRARVGEEQGRFQSIFEVKLQPTQMTIPLPPRKPRKLKVFESL